MFKMGFKQFRDGRCTICGKHAAYYSDVSGKYYCNEHMKQGNPFKVPTFSGDEPAQGAHKYKWGKDEEFKKPKRQVTRNN